jgi:hypothetical protein
MNIINIDVDEKEAKVVYTFIPFILDILEKIEKNADAHFSVTHFLKQQDPKIVDDYKIWQVDDFDYENISHFAHTIPIYLRKYIIESKDDDSIYDKLGCYHPGHKSSPSIELFLPQIKREAGKEYMWLFTKVLLHELSHAVIDIDNIRGFKGTNRMPYNGEFGMWREESMANAITLYIIEKYGPKDLYDYSRGFMENNQTKEYKLGTKIKDVEYWGLRSIYINKLYGAKEDLADEWLKYVKNNIDPDPDKLNEFNERFSKEYEH